MNRTTETRYQRALKRNLHEVGRAILERRALRGLEDAGTSHSLDFIILSYDALFNDMVAHAIKVFEYRKGDASFWYIKRCKEKEVDNFIRKSNIDSTRFLTITDSLKHIRDKTHFHIDRDAVKNSEQIWTDAGVKGSELAQSLDDLWLILSYLYKLEFGEEFVLPRYNGSDATEIAKFAESMRMNTHNNPTQRMKPPR